MISLNRAAILGRLTRDPEVRYTPNGRAVANFGVATNRRFKTAEGNTQDQTEFHDIVAWGKLAEISQQFLHKGDPVYIEGRLQTRSWEAPDGGRRQKTEINAENIIALAPKTATIDIEPEVIEQPTQAGDEAIASAEAPVEPDEKLAKKSKKAEVKIEDIASKNKDEEINLDDLPF